MLLTTQALPCFPATPPFHNNSWVLSEKVRFKFRVENASPLLLPSHSAAFCKDTDSWHLALSNKWACSLDCF